MNSGIITVSAAGVAYRNAIGPRANNHSYSFDQIADTSFSLTHVGLNPQAGYNVLLKDGTKYIYTYSPIQKNKMNTIDAAIRANISKD